MRKGLRLPFVAFLIYFNKEGLSLALKKSQGEGLLSGIKVSRVMKILHLLFVHDILIMTKDSIEEWKKISRVMDLFCRASGLQINAQKTTFLQYGVQQQVLHVLKIFFIISSMI
jgi:hypothetical protein